MAIFLFVLFILGFVHLTYEMIVLPTIQLNYRFKLFALRDKLRRLKIENESKFDKQVFYIMNESLNNAIDNIPAISISLIIESRNELNKSEELRIAVEKRKELIRLCELAEAKEVIEEAQKEVAWIFFFNTASWLIYIIPLFLLLLFGLVIGETMASFTSSVSNVIFTSNKDMLKLRENAGVSVA